MATSAQRRAYLREYQRKWMARRRERGIELLGGKCVRCGSMERLEIDHIDPQTKDQELRDLPCGFQWSWAWSRVLAELAKCQLLCADCHLQKSKGEGARGEQIGSAKLTEAQVRAIRESSLPLRTLGALFGVHHQTIADIRNGVTWRHVV